MVLRVLRGLGICLLAVALVGVAPAQENSDRELAKSRFETGQRLYQRAQYADALAEFEAARKVMNAPAFDYNIGMCLEALGRAHEAADAFQRYLAEKPDDPDAATLRSKIARLRATSPPQGEVHAPPEKKPAPIAAPPSVAPASSPTQPAAVASAPTVAHTRKVRTRAAIAMSVVGGALVVAGAASGGVALSRRSTYDTSCDGGRCDQARYDQAHAAALACDVMLSLGIAAAVTGVVLFATRPRERRVALAPLLGPKSAGLAVGGVF
ncbi:MAG TPA: tetratricopeptide repeat protein [Polyangia bacterium]